MFQRKNISHLLASRQLLVPVTVHQHQVRAVSTDGSNHSNNVVAVQKDKKFEYYKHVNEAQNINVKPEGWDQAIPFEKVPGPKPLPIIGNIWRFLVPRLGDFHGMDLLDIIKKMRDTYGDVAILGGLPGRDPIVYISNPKDFETVHRNEGAWPIRHGLPSFVYYKNVTKKDIYNKYGGVLTVQGEDWFKFRSVVNPILMQPRNALQYVKNMDIVADQFIENIQHFASLNPNREMPENFMNEIHKWALESIGVVTMDRHLGCLRRDLEADSDQAKLIRSALELFDLMYKLDVLPSFWRTIPTPAWKRFVKVLDYLTETNRKYINEVLEKVSKGPETPYNERSVLQKLLAKDKDIAITMALDMMIAGIDTTLSYRHQCFDLLDLISAAPYVKSRMIENNLLAVGYSNAKTNDNGDIRVMVPSVGQTARTVGSILYYLAKYKDKQEVMRQEALQLLPTKDTPVTKEKIMEASYLKACIKEATRMTPIAAGNLRATIRDLVIGGYQIPKGTEIFTTNLMVSQDEKYFPRPLEFIPERWLRCTTGELSYKNTSQFVSLPFGFGARSCIGKRLANMEMEVAILKIIRNFELDWPHEDMVFTTFLLHGISRPLKIKVTPLPN